MGIWREVVSMDIVSLIFFSRRMDILSGGSILTINTTRMAARTQNNDDSLLRLPDVLNVIPVGRST